MDLHRYSRRESGVHLFRAYLKQRDSVRLTLQARRAQIDRDVKRVHTDLVELIEYNLVERTESGKVRVPYDVIHADCDLRAVA